MVGGSAGVERPCPGRRRVQRRRSRSRLHDLRLQGTDHRRHPVRQQAHANEGESESEEYAGESAPCPRSRARCGTGTRPGPGRANRPDSGVRDCEPPLRGGTRRPAIGRGRGLRAGPVARVDHLRDLRDSLLAEERRQGAEPGGERFVLGQHHTAQGHGAGRPTGRAKHMTGVAVTAPSSGRAEPTVAATVRA